MNRNILYIVLVIVVIALVAVFSMQNRPASNEEISEVATTTETTASTTNATTTDSLSQTNGSATTPSKGKIIPGYPSSWPSDVPRYPTEVVKYTGGNNPQSGPVEATVVFTTKDSVKTVVNFYLTELVANGWKITEDGAGTANMTTFRAVKAKRNVGGYAVRETNGKTTVTIGVNIGI